MRILLITLFIGLGTANCSAQTDTLCPLAAFNLVDSTNWCPTGDFDLGWSFCNETGTPTDYWTADSVVWNMGDGTVLTTLDTSAVQHTYSVGGTVYVSAMAYFTGELNEICTVPLYEVEVVSGGTGSPCDLFDTSLDSLPDFSSQLELTLYVANPSIYFSTPDACAGETITIYNSGIISPTPSSYTDWTYELLVDGVSVTTGSGIPTSGTSIYSDVFEEGDYMFEIIYQFNNYVGKDSCSTSNTFLLTVEDCDTCTNCNSFRPLVGERYWISAWVKEDQTTPVMGYEKSMIRLLFTGGSGEAQFLPTGDLVEGWQRIVGSFTIPTGTTDLDIQLINTDGTINSYFDDVRIHPFNASMKSYVYDSETLWLTAELDDNNYATFYEYDLEGQLIRIKKETARGIMTIQESRSSNPKN